MALVSCLYLLYRTYAYFFSVILLDALRQYFSQFGKVDACTIMRDAAGRSRGFAFLTFEEPAAVNAVMVREHYLDGKVVSSLRMVLQLYLRTLRYFRKPD